MGKKRTFKIDNDIVDIPVEEVDVFLKEVPTAKEVQSYLIGKDTVDIPIEEVDVFKSEVPDAKPLFQDDSDTTDVPSGPPIPPTRGEINEEDIPVVSMGEDGEVTPVVKLDKKTRDIFVDHATRLPDNIKLDPTNSNIFVNQFAKSRNVDKREMRKLLDQVVLYKKLHEEYEKDKENYNVLFQISNVLKSIGKDELSLEARDAAEGILQRKGEQLPAVGDGSFVQPTSSTPSTFGFSGRRGDDTMPTKESEYLNLIAEGIGQSSLIKPMSEMGLHGLEKTSKAFKENASIADRSMNLVTGLIETAMGAAGLATPAGAAFGLPFMQVQNSLPPEVVEWMMPVSKLVQDHYKEQGKEVPDWATNTAVLWDFAIYAGLGAGANKVGKAYGKNQAAKEAVRSDAKATYEAILDRKTQAKETLDIVKEVSPEEVSTTLNHIEGKIQELGGVEQYVAERTKVLPEIAKRAEEIKQDIKLEQDSQIEVEPYEPKPQPNSLATVKEGTSVMMDGVEGIIERGDDGTWYFTNDEGKSTQIKVEDKYNPTEPLKELGIQVMPEVSPEQVARAVADAEQIGEVTYKGKQYFVSLDRAGNENPNGDIVLRRMPDGTLKDVFGSHPDPKFAAERKLAIINKMLAEKPTPLPPRKKLTEAGKKVEPVAEPKVEVVEVEPVKTEPISEPVKTETVEEVTTPKEDGKNNQERGKKGRKDVLTPEETTPDVKAQRAETTESVPVRTEDVVEVKVPKVEEAEVSKAEADNAILEKSIEEYESATPERQKELIEQVKKQFERAEKGESIGFPLDPKMLETAKKFLEKVEKPTVEVVGNIGREVEFEHAGQKMFGTIIEEANGRYIIKSSTGREYPIAKNKAQILERSVEQILQERRNLTNVALVGGINIKMPSDLWGKIKKWSTKNLTVKGGLPSYLFQGKVGMEGGKTAAMTQIRYSVQQLRDAIKTDYGKSIKFINAVEINKMDKFLKGDTSQNLPANVKIALTEMRLQVDALSRRLVAEGIAEGDLALTIEQNEGVYVTRSYRLHDDPAWADVVPETIRNNAKGYLRNEYPLATPEQIDGLINKLLYSADAPMSILAGAKLGSKDLGIFKKRKNIPLEIRQLMGEYQDPIVNYAKSVYKMSALIEHSKFLNDAYANGIDKVFFKQPEGQYAVEIAGQNNKAYSPLNGLYTTPDLAEIMSGVRKGMDMPDWFNYYMTVNSTIKAGKTIGSIGTHIRNVLSNVFFVVNNGHFLNPKGASKAWGVVKAEWKNKSSQETLEYIQDLQRRGVLDDGANAGELRGMIEDATKRFDEVQDFIKDDVLNRVKKGAVKLYHLEDAVYKVYAFEAEKARYMDAGFSLTEASDIAATNVRNLYPTYSLVPNIVKGLRRFPLTGTFVSFPAEVIRTYGNTWALAAREIKDPRTRKIGITRMSMLITGSLLVKGISQMSKQAWDVTPDEEKALRRMQPPWSKNSDYVYVGRDDKGVLVYVDLGYSDPYNYLKNPINAFMLADNPIDGLAEGFGDLVEPFIGTEMLAQKLIDVKANKKEGGGTVYNEQLPVGDQAKQVWEYMNDVAYPGTITSMQRIYKGYKGESSASGKQYDFETELAATLTGQRINRTDVTSALSFKSYQFKKDMQEASQIQTKAFYQKLSIEQQREALFKSNVAREKIYNDFVADYMAARKLGVTQEQANRIFKKNGISAGTVENIEAQVPYIQSSRDFVDLLNGGSPVGRAENFVNIWKTITPEEQEKLIDDAVEKTGILTVAFWDELKAIDEEVYGYAKAMEEKSKKQ